MGLFGDLLGGDDWRDKPKDERRADLNRHRASKSALNANSEREHKRGVRDETVTYYQLNEAVIESEKHVPWWAR